MLWRCRYFWLGLFTLPIRIDAVKVGEFQMAEISLKLLLEGLKIGEDK